MRARLGYSILATLCSVGVACSSAPPKVEAAAAPDAPANGGTEVEADLALTPVNAPENLLGVATLRTPARTLDTALGWTRLGLDWRALAQTGRAAEFMPLLDLDAPIDVVVALDPTQKSEPRPFIAGAVGLRSRQAALDALNTQGLTAEYVEPGVHSVQLSPKTTCLIAAALGKAKARLVCAENRAALDALGPYLARGNPSANTGEADLHVDVRAEAPWRLYGDKTQFLKLAVPMVLGEASLGNPEFDTALRDAANAVMDEVILALKDSNELRLDAWLREAEQELEVQLAVEFKAAQSWLASTLRDAAGRAITAPELFWKLPGDATEAVFYAPTNPETRRPMLSVLERLARGGLSHLGASPASQKDWPRTFNELLTMSGAVVSARGNVSAATLAAANDPHSQVRASIGYTIVGTEDEGARYAAFIEQTLKLYEDPALRKNLTQKYGLETAKLPKVQSRKGPSRLPEARTYEIALPASIYNESLPAENAVKLDKPIPIVIVTCRQGKTSWIGVSSYADLLEDRLSALIAGPEPAATLERKAGLERLRREPSLVGGYWTLAGLQRSTPWGKTELAEVLSPLGTSETPIIGRTIARAEGPSGTLHLHVPSQLFAEVATAVQKQAR